MKLSFMIKNIFLTALSATALATAVSCNRQSLDLYSDTAPGTYYLLTLENSSSTDIVWFIPYAETATGAPKEKLPESLSGTASCIFRTPSRERESAYVTGEVSSPFESYDKAALVPFYVFDKAVFDGEDWTSIREGEKWLAKFQLSAQEVISRGKKIVYTGED